MPKGKSQPPETSSRRSGEKTWWHRRSQLEKRLLIALGAIMVVVVGFMTYVGIKPKNTSDSCVTTGCLKAAAQIITHIDPDFDPCEDFFKFACGGFIEHTHGDINAASLQRTKNQVDRQFAEILREPINDNDHYVVQMEKQLFQACMNETAVEEESLDIFKEHLQELKGWPVVIGYKWKERLFDWTEMVTKLRTMGYPYTMMMDVGVIHDPSNSNQVIPYISEPHVLHIEKKHKELYKIYMTDVAMMFGAVDRHRVSLEMEKVIDFSEKLVKMVEKVWDIDNVTDTNYTAKLLEARFRIKDFRAYDDDIDWLDFLNTMIYPVANISSSDYAIFPDNDFLEAFFTLIYKTPKRVLESLAYFYPKELKYLHGNYSCLVQQDSSISKDRFDFCKRAFTGNMNIVYARRYLPPDKREKVQELVSSVKSEFKTLLMENSWMDEETKEKALEKADAINEIIGAPGDYFDDEVLEKYKRVNYTQGESFLNMILRRSKHEYDVMFSLIETTLNVSNEDIFYDVTTKVNAMYSPYENALILPAAILQEVFYNPDGPMFLNYGIMGSIIGHELTHGFSKEASKFDKDIKNVSIWTEETEIAYDKVVQCLIKDAEDFDIEDTVQRINGRLTLEENLADFAGIKASYAAYRTWVEENGEEAQLPGVDYTANQLFWISAISVNCYKLRGKKLEKRLQRDNHAHNAFRATAPLRNNEDFANDFNCPANSKMNPSEKCQVF